MSVSQIQNGPLPANLISSPPSTNQDRAESEWRLRAGEIISWRYFRGEFFAWRRRRRVREQIKISSSTNQDASGVQLEGALTGHRDDDLMMRQSALFF